MSPSSWAVCRMSAKSRSAPAPHARRRCAMPVIEVTEIDVGYDIAERLRETEARRRLQRAARALRRGRHDPGRARIPAHPLHAFGRARLGAGDGQAPGQDHVQGGRHSGHRPRHRAVAPRSARAHVMAPPYVVKPIADGSSRRRLHRQGRPVASAAGNPAATDWKGGEELMVERYIPGRELTCAVMGDVALGVTEIVTDLAFYNYEAKYAAGGSRHIVPARRETENLRQSAEDGAQGACCAWVPRRLADRLPLQRRAGEDGELVCLEINTQPGMTELLWSPNRRAMRATRSRNWSPGWWRTRVATGRRARLRRCPACRPAPASRPASSACRAAPGISFGHAWILHRKLIAARRRGGHRRCSPASALYEARDDRRRGRGRRLRPGAGRVRARRLRHRQDQHHRPVADQRGDDPRGAGDRAEYLDAEFRRRRGAHRASRPSPRSSPPIIRKIYPGELSVSDRREGADGALAHRRQDLSRR